MPHTCCVPECNGNTKNGPKVHMFSFPNEPAMRQKWISTIPRKDFIPSRNSKVCELHFIKEHIIRSVSREDSKTGIIISAPLTYPKLHADAIPFNFPNCPKYFSKVVNYRQGRHEKLKVLEEQQFLEAIEKSKEEHSIREQSITFKNYDEFCNKLKNIKLQQDWFNISSDSQVTLLKIENSPGPVISYAVVIKSNFEVETFLYGKIINFNVDKLTTPFTVSDIQQIQNLLDTVEEHSLQSSQSMDHKEKIIHHVCNILNSFENSLENIEGTVENTDQNNMDNNCLSFIIEQLKLFCTPKQRYRYSVKTLILSSILLTISPHAYKYLRHYGGIFLPHPKTLRTICNDFLTVLHLKRDSLFCNMLKIFFLILQTRKNLSYYLWMKFTLNPF